MWVVIIRRYGDTEVYGPFDTEDDDYTESQAIAYDEAFMEATQRIPIEAWRDRALAAEGELARMASALEAGELRVWTCVACHIANCGSERCWRCSERNDCRDHGVGYEGVHGLGCNCEEESP